MSKNEQSRDAEVAVLQTNFANMNSSLEEIKDTLKKFIERADSTYATKVEHLANLERIKEIENTQKTKINTIIGAMFTIILALIWAIWSQLHNIPK